MSNAIKVLSNSLASLVTGELSGFLAKEGSKIVKVSRRKLGDSVSSTGPGLPDTMLDISLDLLIDMTFLVLAVSFTQKSLPSVTNDLYGMILYIIGLSATTDLPQQLRTFNNRLKIAYDDSYNVVAKTATTVVDTVAPDRQ